MGNLEENYIVKDININTNHIDNYQLETTEGTKKVKEIFYKTAVLNRNDYVTKEIEKFENYKNDVANLLNDRVNDILPIDNSSKFDSLDKRIEEIEKLVIYSDNSIDDAYKLGIDFLLAQINDEISLVQLNKLLNEYFKIFEEASVGLTLDDFCYTMYTENFMDCFIDHRNDEKLDERMQEVFEKLYFECPMIIEQIKNNLIYIVKKYSKELKSSVSKKLDEGLKREEITLNNLVSNYLDTRLKLENEYDLDPYYLLDMFITNKRNINEYVTGAMARINNFNRFAVNGNYDELDDTSKIKYDESMLDFYNTYTELNEYYRYESIIKDLITKFKERNTFASQYNSKLKEIEAEEKNRLKISKAYLKACGVGFLARVNHANQKLLKMQMNDQANKLDNLYKEARDLKIGNNFATKLNDASSIYDLLITAFSSFSYLNSKFNELFGMEKDYDFKKEFERFFRFLYSPYNDFLRRTSCLNDFDMATILADKYKLLGLNVNNEDLSSANYMQTFDIVKFIKIVINANKCSLSLRQIKFICDKKNTVFEEEKI